MSLDFGGHCRSECDGWVGTFTTHPPQTKSSLQPSLTKRWSRDYKESQLPLCESLHLSCISWTGLKVLCGRSSRRGKYKSLFTSKSLTLIHKATEVNICLSAWCKWEGIMPPLLMKNKVPGIFQIFGAQVLLRSQHLASEVYVFPKQRVDLATSDLAKRYHFLCLLTTDAALLISPRPSEHCMQNY